MSAAPVIPGTIEKPTREQAVAINALGFLCAQVIEDDRWPMALELLAAAAPALPRWDVGPREAVPMMERLARVAERVIADAPARFQRGGSTGWMLVMLDARAVLADINWARVCLLAPEPQTEPQTPTSAQAKDAIDA